MYGHTCGDITTPARQPVRGEERRARENENVSQASSASAQLGFEGGKSRASERRHIPAPSVQSSGTHAFRLPPPATDLSVDDGVVGEQLVLAERLVPEGAVLRVEPE